MSHVEMKKMKNGAAAAKRHHPFPIRHTQKDKV
jgi:hypothetical protein